MKSVERVLIAVLAIVVVILAALLVGRREEAINPEAERAAIREADGAWSNAAGAKDLERTVSYYADDASMLAPNAPIAAGKQAIRAAWEGLFKIPGLAISWEPSKVEVSAAGDLAYSQGIYELTMSGPAGKPVTDRGKYVVVWKKQPDGSWKAVADIFNSDLAPPPAKP